MMSMDTLLRDLREGATKQRQHAAQALRNYGAAAVEPLCLALRDKDLSVRVAAAESLGLVGDERAVQGLMEALWQCFVGRSARWQIIAGVGVFITLFLPSCIAIWAGRFWTFWMGLGFSVLGGMFTGMHVGKYFVIRAAQSNVCHAIIAALMHIAECHPAPELRSILPDLKTLAIDVLQQDKQTRATSRQAAQRIEALTEQLKSLPLPAAAPAPAAATLPRTVDAPVQETERLPRVTVNE
jgi:hypothetical protein